MPMKNISYARLLLAKTPKTKNPLIKGRNNILKEKSSWILLNTLEHVVVFEFSGN